MFTLETTTNHKRFLRSSLLESLGARHAFTTIDWDIKTPDDARSLLDDLHIDTPRLRMSKQIHGCTVTSPPAPGSAPGSAPVRAPGSAPGERDSDNVALLEADAHVTDDPDESVVVRTADCVPILVSGEDGRHVAAIHAGWRGLDPGTSVIARAVEALRRQRGASRLLAAVGPCISADHYEVGEEVASRFRSACPEAVRDGVGVKPRLELRRVAVAQLLAAGLAVDDIDVYGGCTFTDAALLHSHRRCRQRGRPTAHLAALIVPLSPLG